MIVRAMMDIINKGLAVLDEIPSQQWQPEEIDEFEEFKGTVHDIVEKLVAGNTYPERRFRTPGDRRGAQPQPLMLLDRERRAGVDRRYAEPGRVELCRYCSESPVASPADAGRYYTEVEMVNHLRECHQVGAEHDLSEDVPNWLMVSALGDISRSFHARDEGLARDVITRVYKAGLEMGLAL